MKLDFLIRSELLKGRYFLAGLVISACFYLLDSVVMATFFDEGSIWRHIVKPTPDDIWMRSAIATILIVAGAVIDRWVKTLRESEERYERSVEGTYDGLWDWDILADKTYYSPRWAEIVGHTQEELGSGPNRFYERLHPNDRDRVWGDMKAHLERRTPFQNIEFRFRHKTGKYIWARSRGRAVWDKNGNAIRMAGSLTDITDQKNAEKKLQISERRYRSIIDTTNEGFSRIDENMRLVEVNDALCRMLGYEREELIGKRPFDLVDPEEYPDLEERITESILRGNRAKNREVKFTRKNGSFVDVHVSSNSYFDEEGNLAGRFSFVTDLSEQKEREAQLRQAQKMEAVGQLTGGVAHEFNNLLMVIFGNLEALESRLAKHDPLRSFTSSAMKGALRGAELTQSLLAFSRKQQLQSGLVDLNKLILGMHTLLQRTLGETIVIETDLAEGLWHTAADAGQIEASLLNFALNARDAMPDGGTITLHTANQNLTADTTERYDSAEAGEYVKLQVRDTGTGMNEEQIGHAFEPFFTTKSVGEGTGLGLSVAFGFASQSKGCLEIESEPGKGTSVSLYLPRTAEEENEAEQEQEASSTIATGSGRILVVEDDADVRVLVVSQLTEIGYEVYDVADGRAALAFFTEHPDIDLLFSDVVLPGGMNGPEIARRAQKNCPDLKVLLTSGYPEKDVEYLSVDGRNMTILRKPFRQLELAQAVAAAMISEPI